VSSDDAWLALHLTSVTRSVGNCAASVLVDPVLDAGRPSWRLAFAGAVPPTLAAGATVRLTRVARFALYRSGAEWWLGFTERNPATGAWVTIQPVSGPYLPFNAAMPAASGIALQGRDSSGTATMLAGAGSPAALSMATRTRTTSVVRMDGLARARYADSLHSLIALRNAR
jgi:hypothetical protein